MARAIAGRKEKKVNQNQEFLATLRAISEDRGIDPEVLFDAIEEALISAYKRNFGATKNVKVTLSRDTGQYNVYAIKTVVEMPINSAEEISLKDAKKINSDYELGDVLQVEVTPANFGRIAAQLAKQVVVQRLKEAERSIVYDEYASYEGEILTGLIQRIEGLHVFLDLGNTEAVLMPSEQVPGEMYTRGEHLKVFVAEVKKMSRGSQVLVSRTHPGLVKKLFELQVPEIQDGTVEIVSVAREAGQRSKIAVRSHDASVDPIGSCIGVRGLRANAVLSELGGREKVDIIKWSEDPARFIANSLSPSKVTMVAVKEEEKISHVVVPDYQLSLAIGKDGQNARLAAKLTGWKIDIQSESQAAQAVLDKNENDVYFLEDENMTVAESENV